MSGHDERAVEARPVAPELSRPFPIARIGDGAVFVVEADEAERRALAARMGLPAIHRLTCRFDLKRSEADAVEAVGLLQARVRQCCVLSLEPFDADLAESFSVRFVPDGKQSEALDLESDDEVTYRRRHARAGRGAARAAGPGARPVPAQARRRAARRGRSASEGGRLCRPGQSCCRRTEASKAFCCQKAAKNCLRRCRAAAVTARRADAGAGPQVSVRFRSKPGLPSFARLCPASCRPC